MDLSHLRRLLETGNLSVRLTTHARIEAMKDGLTEVDLRRTLEQGEEIEDYPDRLQALLLGWTIEASPCHAIEDEAEAQAGYLEIVHDSFLGAN